MENRDQQNPELNQDTTSQAQAQQPTGQQQQPQGGYDSQQTPETGESGSFETGQADYGSAGSDTMTKSDVETSQISSDQTASSDDSVIGKSEDLGSDSLINKENPLDGE